MTFARHRRFFFFFLGDSNNECRTAKYFSSILPGSFLLCMDGDETALAEAAVNSLRRREE